ncbi:MAG: hypothetical protein V1734_00415 [Nanoarchaeota archaeon]
MKKTAIVFVCIILLAAFAYAQNETESNVTALNTSALNPAPTNETIPAAAPLVTPPAATPKAAVDPNCNKNKIVDAGENCFNCPSDVKCQSGEQCLDTGVCKANINYTTYIILGIGAFLFIGVIIFARRFVFKKPKEEPKPIQQQVQQPVQQSNVAQEPVQMPPEVPSSVPAEIPVQQPPQAVQEPQQPMNQEFPLMAEPVNEHPGETDAQKFIRQMREKGWNDERIRMKLKEAGWSETQIALAFLKAPKFVKKS